MSTDHARTGARAEFTAAYAAFLASLVLPGAGQVLTGVAARGLVLFLLAAGWLALLGSEHLQLPTTRGAGLVDVIAAALAAGVWSFAAYDAWLRARENALGMSALLPRTPRVAAAADLLWGGAGHLYLGRRVGLPTVAGTAALSIALAVMPASRTVPLVIALALWNSAWAWRAWAWAAARWHGTPEWAARRNVLDQAPFASALNPSPSLPLVTLVAALIAVLGLGLVQRARREIASPEGPAARSTTTARIEGGQLIDEVQGVRLALPIEGWTLAAGPAPTLLAGRRTRDGTSLTLALAEQPLFEAGDIVPGGALESYAVRQEEDLRRTLAGFRALERRVGSFGGAEGVRLLFQAAPGGRPVLVGQHYRRAGTRVAVLTLSGPPDTPPAALERDLDILLSGLHLRETQP